MHTIFPSGFYPFWFWNDRLAAGEIERQVAQMAAQGIRGFFIHSRQGLGQPYLSESFFAMVHTAIAAAEANGLTVHLYDEYPYPSGVAGGEVLAGNPQFWATQLVQQMHDVSGGAQSMRLPEGKVLAALAYPLVEGHVNWTRGIDLRDDIGMLLVTDSYNETGLTRYNQKRYFASQPTPALETTLPPGRYRIYLSVQSVVSRHKYWGQYVDALNPEAVRLYLQLTHERYWQHFAAKFGTVILSIFTDEIQPGWSDRLPAAFQGVYGYDLLPLLPALQDETHPDHLRVSYDLYRLQYQLFAESFEAPVAEWCRAHGLAYAGEKPSLMMAQLKFMDIPGCEPGHTKAGVPLDLWQASLRQNARATASAAYFYGKAGALDECYHSLGWSATLQDVKLMAEGQLLAGISYLVPHGFFYSTHGLKKHDAPPSLFFQAPYWPLFGHLAERVNRIGNLFDGTYIDAQTVVVEASGGLPTAEARETYTQILDLLLAEHIDFHIAGPDIIEGAELVAGTLHLRDLRVRLVLVPPMRVVEPSLSARLAEYAAAGGHVLYCEDQGAVAELGRQIKALVEPSLHIRRGTEEVAEVLVVKRAGGPRPLWFVLNTGSEPVRAELDAGVPLREVSVESRAGGRLEQADGHYLRVLAPYESALIEAGVAPEPVQPLSAVTVHLGGEMQVRPLNSNLLRMADWRMSLLDQDASTRQAVTVPAIPLSHQLQRGHFQFAPAIRRDFGLTPALGWPELRVRYEYEFSSDYDGAVELVMEPGSIVGEWALWFNDQGPLDKSSFGPTQSHVHGSLGVAISPWLHNGANRLRLEVTTDLADGGLVNPLYLAGDFGVQVRPATLVRQLDKGHFEAYESNALPYFAGAIEYTLPVDIDRLPATARTLVRFETEAPFHEACEIRINDSDPYVLAWEPRAIEIETTHLKTGQNTLKVRVYTTLVRAFEGQWFDYRTHTYRNIAP